MAHSLAKSFAFHANIRGRIQNISFCSKLTNWPQKLDSLSLVSLSTLLWCNTRLMGQFLSYEENEEYEFGETSHGFNVLPNHQKQKVFLTWTPGRRFLRILLDLSFILHKRRHDVVVIVIFWDAWRGRYDGRRCWPGRIRWKNFMLFLRGFQGC
jgi:hypothetical protein